VAGQVDVTLADSQRYLRVGAAMTRNRPVAVVGAVVAALVLLLMIGWVSVALVGVPLGGLSRGQATTTASRQVHSDTPAQALNAVPGLFWFFRGGATDAVSPGYRLSWAVTFRGTFSGSCPPAGGPGSPSHCLPTDHTETVILDYMTGAFIMASITP